MRILRLFPILFLAFFLGPLAARAALFAFEDRPLRWYEADWSSVGVLPPAATHPQARVLVMSGRTGGWKGLVAAHCWIVIKHENAPTWTRYDVVGWGNPVRRNGWAPDGRWFGGFPVIVADVRGEVARAAIPKLEKAIADYRYAHAGDYRLWPGPNSNTFVATVLRAVPELGIALPANAIGKDFRGQTFYFGPTGSQTGWEINVLGILGLTIGWVEGFEVNVLGLVLGADFRRPALKVPGFGHIGVGFPPGRAVPVAA